MRRPPLRHLACSLAAMALAAAVAPSSADSSAVPSASPAGIDIPLRLAWDVVSRRPHDAHAWTQGLVFDAQGRLFESTGLEGASTLREVDPRSGEVLRSVSLPAAWFAEGLAVAEDRLIQLTWRDGIATAWDPDTFEPLARHGYEGEGWGLCFDGWRLVMSDGSARLTFRDPETFAATGSVEVRLAGEPLQALNELECVDGVVWANVWRTDRIVRIDPTTGEVSGVLDLARILEAEPAPGDPPPDVLNGIAHDPATGTLLVTGKYWPELIEIRVREGG